MIAPWQGSLDILLHPGPRRPTRGLNLTKREQDMQVHVIIRAEPVFQVDDVHVQHQQVDGSDHLDSPSKALHGPDAHTFEWLTVIVIRSLVEDEHADG